MEISGFAILFALLVLVIFFSIVIWLLKNLSDVIGNDVGGFSEGEIESFEQKSINKLVKNKKK